MTHCIGRSQQKRGSLQHGGRQLPGLLRLLCLLGNHVGGTVLFTSPWQKLLGQPGPSPFSSLLSPFDFGCNEAQGCSSSWHRTGHEFTSAGAGGEGDARRPRGRAVPRRQSLHTPAIRLCRLRRSNHRGPSAEATLATRSLLCVPRARLQTSSSGQMVNTRAAPLGTGFTTQSSYPVPGSLQAPLLKRGAVFRQGERLPALGSNQDMGAHVPPWCQEPQLLHYPSQGLGLLGPGTVSQKGERHRSLQLWCNAPRSPIAHCRSTQAQLMSATGIAARRWAPACQQRALPMPVVPTLTSEAFSLCTSSAAFPVPPCPVPLQPPHHVCNKTGPLLR